MSRDGISAFLLARIAEEEAQAHLATVPRYAGMTPNNGDEWASWYMSVERDATIHQDRHVSEWWPGRVLAECAAKRAIIRHGTEPPAAPMLRALAAVYKDHPDYREEWSQE